MSGDGEGQEFVEFAPGDTASCDINELTTALHLKSYCSEIQHRLKPAVHIQHTILS